MKILFALLIPTLSYGQWNQVGQPITGESSNGQSGYSVSLNDDGTVIAIGAPFNSDNGSASGQVRVFENESGTWVQKGSDLNGMASSDKFGFSVSLSSDGNTVAVGAPDANANGFESGEVRIYNYTSDEWQEIGVIEGESWGDHSGLSISLNNTGNILSIGSQDNDGPDMPPYDSGSNFGQVRIYENMAGIWTQTGNLLGVRAEDNFGYRTQLNALGDIVVVGAPNYDLDENIPGQESGQVVVFQKISDTWEQINEPILGEFVHNAFGESVSINDMGNIIAFSSLNYGGYGLVRVYENLSESWVQKGGDIIGENVNDGFGISISLNGSGDVIAIGGHFNDGSFLDAGHVRVFKYQSGVWGQVLNDIDGEANQDRSGYSVSLSNDGNIVAIGAYLNDNSGDNAGNARIFENENSVDIAQTPALKETLLYPNPATKEITVRFAKTYSIVKISVYDFTGKQINYAEYAHSNQLNMQIGTYPSGFYLIKFQTEEETFSTNLIKK